MSLYGIINISPVHYIAVPLLAAFLIPIIGLLSKKLTYWVPGLVLFYLAFISTVLLPAALKTPIVEVLAGWHPPLGINLYYGAVGGFLASLFAVLGFVIWIYSIIYMKNREEELPMQKYYMLFMMLIAGATGIVLTGDIFNLFVFLEITAIAAYSLTAFLQNRHGAEAAFKYILMGSLASTFILLAIVILYAYTGTLNMADIAQKMGSVPYYVQVFILLLFITGFGIEAELFPLNGWAPDAYMQAPVPVAAIFGGIVVKAGVYALIRVIFTLFSISSSFYLISVLGLITLIIAEMTALKQKDIKRMLAYSSIGQMGLVIVAFGIGTDKAVYGALFAMFSHAIIKPLLFFTAGYLAYKITGASIDDLKGIGRKKPFTSFFFVLAALSIIGLPPFAGFWGKYYILSAMIDAGHIGWVLLVLSASVIEAVYYLRMVVALYETPQNDPAVAVKTSLFAGIPMIILGAAIITIGVYPNLLTDILLPGVQELMNPGDYIQNTLTVR